MLNDFPIIIPETTFKTIGKGLKILSSKQILQRLPIVLAQVKADDASDTLLNEIIKITYSLSPAKEITKKVNDNLTKSIQI